jgi:uncharacterized protein
VTDLDDELVRVRTELCALRRSKPATHDDLIRLQKHMIALIAAKHLAAPIAQRRADGKTVERRAITRELRARGRRLEGYAAVFGTEARIADFVETIAPGAFATSLAERADILALVDHDPGRVLARTRSGTLRLAEDSRGLAFDLDVPATTVGNDVLALAERGDIGGASFAFTVKREMWSGERRTLEAVDLHEVSIVQSWPAYPDTLVQARARPVFHPRIAAARRFLDTL